MPSASVTVLCPLVFPGETEEFVPCNDMICLHLILRWNLQGAENVPAIQSKRIAWQGSALGEPLLPHPVCVG